MNLSTLPATLAQLDLRSCLIQRQGKLIFEYYRDQHIPSELAKINSCTKSILSALIGIAIDKGLLSGVSAPLREFFPQLTRDADSRKQHITLEQLLNMSAGFRWTEFGGANSFPKMTRSSHWINYVLEQPLAEEPGVRMEYNSGISQLLSAILVQAAGRSTAEFAEEFLFGPLGIREYEWETDPQGIHTGGYGLKLRPADLLNFGQLYLQEGIWQGVQLLSGSWVKQSVQPAMETEPPRHGGYAWHWWTESMIRRSGSDESVIADYYYARGYAGQFVYVLPALQLVVVLTQDNKRGRNNPPPDVFRDYLSPLLKATSS
ncbi:serine hydrolase [Paenibacillus sp. FSL K6-1096]|uniref:serine hydrolase domain-containing protein n=1 Tax=Paenibacillus sp. FSL K6-1096 TaxID=2921460 RepID=UPI0030EBF3D0